VRSLLKARIVEPEETAVAIEQIGKQASAATDTHETIKLLEVICYMHSMQSVPACGCCEIIAP
jgi:hypothetical protein